MTSNIVYLITGANRGIGLGLTSTLLLRANTTVIATVRSSATSTKDLTSLPTVESSKVIIAPLSSASDTDASALVASLSSEHGITHIDTVIANAGSGLTFDETLATPIEELRENFEINTLSVIKLFQATYPLLQKSKNPKLIFISSSLGSIEAMEGNIPSLAYGMSKAGGNYFMRKVHFEHQEVTALTIHPGWVKTANGQNFADKMGIKEPPMSLEQSVKGVMQQIDDASRTSTSGCFVAYNGTVIPW